MGRQRTLAQPAADSVALPSLCMAALAHPCPVSPAVVARQQPLPSAALARERGAPPLFGELLLYTQNFTVYLKIFFYIYPSNNVSVST